MGVYIKGMEMPKDGVYWCEIGVAGDIATITIHGEDRKSFHLVPVPPHGDLIDRDVLKENCMKEDSFLAELLFRKVSNAPTIIQAEGGARHESA